MKKYRILPVGLALLLAVGCATQPCQVSNQPNPMPAGISVSGDGEVEGSPDLAVATLGVEVRSASVKEATEKLADQMDSVVKKLKELGVAEGDIQTAQLSIYLEHVPGIVVPMESNGERPGPKAEPAPQHRATNTVTVKIRDLNQASTIVSEALGAGANTVQGIQFDIENKEPLLAEARKESMMHAHKNAEQLAQLAGVKLGPPRQISENANYSRPMMQGARYEAMDAAKMPVEQGTLTLSHNVQVTYDIQAK